MAAATTATFAVVSGGVGCLAVLGLVGTKMPELRRYRIGEDRDDARRSGGGGDRRGRDGDGGGRRKQWRATRARRCRRSSASRKGRGWLRWMRRTSFVETLGALPVGAEVLDAHAGRRDRRHRGVRARTRGSGGTVRGRSRSGSRPAGGLWIAWPKSRPRRPSPVSETLVRETGLAAGLVDNKVCAIDEEWSGVAVRAAGKRSVALQPTPTDINQNVPCRNRPGVISVARSATTSTSTIRRLPRRVCRGNASSGVHEHLARQHLQTE